MDGRSPRLVLAALGVAVFVCAGTLWAGITHRFYDVDELQHAHIAWLVHQGDRPYHEFVETHPPFVAYLASTAFAVLPERQTSLAVLRLGAASLGALFIALLILSVKVGREELRTGWLVAGTLCILAHPRVLEFLFEIRPDTAAYAIFFAAVLWTRRRPPTFGVDLIKAFLGGTSVLWTPKLGVVMLALLGFDLLPRRLRSWPAAVGAYAAGGALALAVAVLCLKAAGIDSRLAYELSFGFHGRFLEHASFHGGVRQQVQKQPVALALIVAGAVVAIVRGLRRRRLPTPLEGAILVHLMAALWLFHLPYKQYFAPWFILGSVFVPHLVLLAPPRWRSLAALALVTFAVAGGIHSWRSFGRFEHTALYQHLWGVMGRAVPRESRIVVDPNFHPVFRRDVFYGWFSTFDPAGRGTELILREWNPQGYGHRFTSAGYDEELRLHPPALILAFPDGFHLPKTQERSVARWVSAHRHEYVKVPLVGPMTLLVRTSAATPGFLQSVAHAPIGDGDQPYLAHASDPESPPAGQAGVE